MQHTSVCDQFPQLHIVVENPYHITRYTVMINVLLQYRACYCYIADFSVGYDSIRELCVVSPGGTTSCELFKTKHLEIATCCFQRNAILLFVPAEIQEHYYLCVYAPKFADLFYQSQSQLVFGCDKAYYKVSRKRVIAELSI